MASFASRRHLSRVTNFRSGKECYQRNGKECYQRNGNAIQSEQRTYTSNQSTCTQESKHSPILSFGFSQRSWERTCLLRTAFPHKWRIPRQGITEFLIFSPLATAHDFRAKKSFFKRGIASKKKTPNGGCSVTRKFSLQRVCFRDFISSAGHTARD